MPGTRGERLVRGLTAVLIVAALVLGGCAGDPLSTAGEATRDGQVQAWPDGLAGPTVNLNYDTYDEVTSETIRPGKVAVVEGSRYSLEFKEGSLAKQTQITIRERHPYIVDFVLGPEGTTFGDPVTLVIDYAETANDPKMPYFHGKPPIVYLLDEEKGVWVPQDGWDDPEARTYTLLLFHFSRYAMTDGTGGWEGPARAVPRGGKELVTAR